MNTKLKMAILESGFLAYEIAHQAGISETRMSRIVCGRRKASPEEQQRIAKALKRPINGLFG
jgi:transcriptional regulator with XRE-family HTH domain